MIANLPVFAVILCVGDAYLLQDSFEYDRGVLTILGGSGLSPAITVRHGIFDNGQIDCRAVTHEESGLWNISFSLAHIEYLEVSLRGGEGGPSGDGWSNRGGFGGQLTFRLRPKVPFTVNLIGIVGNRGRKGYHGGGGGGGTFLWQQGVEKVPICYLLGAAGGGGGAGRNQLPPEEQGLNGNDRYMGKGKEITHGIKEGFDASLECRNAVLGPPQLGGGVGQRSSGQFGGAGGFGGGGQGCDGNGGGGGGFGGGDGGEKLSWGYAGGSKGPDAKELEAAWLIPTAMKFGKMASFRTHNEKIGMIRIKVQCKPGSIHGSIADTTAIACDQCSPGRFASNGQTCSPCEWGLYAGEGASACEKCPRGEYAHHYGTTCSLNLVYYTKVFSLRLIICLLLMFMVLLLHVAWRSIPLTDVSTMNGVPVVTTKLRHHITPGSWVWIRFFETGDMRLNKKQWFLASATGNYRLELEAVEYGIEFNSSFGFLDQTKINGIFQRCVAVPIYGSLIGISFLAGAMLYVGYSQSILTIYHFSFFFMTPVMASMCGAVAGTILLNTWKMGNTLPIQQRIQSFCNDISRDTYKPESCSRGPDRALQLKKLRGFYEYFQDFILGRNLYYVDCNISRAITQSHKLSYAEVVGPSRADWFVSHFWGTPFANFIQTISKHAQWACDSVDAQDSSSYWICAFSNNQYHIADELGDGDWRLSSFYLTLTSQGVRGTVMVIDEKAEPLTRAWCLFEVYQSFRLQKERPEQFNGLLLCTRSGVLNSGATSVDVVLGIAQTLATLDLGSAQASDARDEKMIKDLVRDSNGSFNSVNNAVRANIGACVKNSKAHVDRDFCKVMDTLEASQGSGENQENQTSWEMSLSSGKRTSLSYILPTQWHRSNGRSVRYSASSPLIDCPLNAPEIELSHLA